MSERVQSIKVATDEPLYPFIRAMNTLGVKSDKNASYVIIGLMFDKIESLEREIEALKGVHLL